MVDLEAVSEPIKGRMFDINSYEFKERHHHLNPIQERILQNLSHKIILVMENNAQDQFFANQ